MPKALTTTRAPQQAQRNAKPVTRVRRASGPYKRTFETRDKIIEAAGRVFADKGFAAAIGKDICDVAGVSAAAINYHFGSMELLRYAALRRAYENLVSFNEFARVLESAAPAEQRLLALCETMVSAFVRAPHHNWELRLIGREAMSPSPETEELRNKQLVPKIMMFRGLVSELTGLPPEHPVVAQGCLSVMAPAVMLQVGDWTAIDRALPGFAITKRNSSEAARLFHAFTLAGLRAMAATAKAESKTRGSPRKRKIG